MIRQPPKYAGLPPPGWARGALPNWQWVVPTRHLRPSGMLTHRRTNTQARKSLLLFSFPSFLPFLPFQPLPVLNFLEDFSFYALNAINHQLLHRLIQIRSPRLRRSTPPRKTLKLDHYLCIHYFQHWLQRPLSYN